MLALHITITDILRCETLTEDVWSSVYIFYAERIKCRRTVGQCHLFSRVFDLPVRPSEVGRQSSAAHSLLLTTIQLAPLVRPCPLHSNVSPSYWNNPKYPPFLFRCHWEGDALLGWLLVSVRLVRDHHWAIDLPNPSVFLGFSWSLVVDAFM